MKLKHVNSKGETVLKSFLNPLSIILKKLWNWVHNTSGKHVCIDKAVNPILGLSWYY